MFQDDEQDEVTTAAKVQPKHQSALPWLTAAIGVGLLILGGLTYFQNAEVQSLRQDVAQLGNNQAKENAALRAIFAKTDQDLQGVLREFRTELTTTRQQNTEGVKKAQVIALRRAEGIATDLESKQKARTEQFNEELAKVRELNTNSETKINSVSSEVGAVKSDLESTKSTIQDARADLQRVRGDMGMMSGLIATNAKEIQVLREMGDRDIFEFTLVKSAGLQQVGDVRMVLKKADTTRNKFTLELLADDKRVEKKDKSLNEPVQFYTSSKASKQPYEIVVNEVKKNTVVGYLARPKLVLAQGRSN